MDHQRIPRTGIALRGSAVYERSRSSAYKLEEHSQQGLVKDGNHLGGSRSGSSKQIRMASECGPMISGWIKINCQECSNFAALYLAFCQCSTGIYYAHEILVMGKLKFCENLILWFYPAREICENLMQKYVFYSILMLLVGWEVWPVKTSASQSLEI